MIKMRENRSKVLETSVTVCSFALQHVRSCKLQNNMLRQPVETPLAMTSMTRTLGGTCAPVQTLFNKLHGKSKKTEASAVRSSELRNW